VGLIGGLALLFALESPLSGESSTRQLPGPPVGVLIADPVHLQSDYDAGVRIATLEVKWRLWQPSPQHTSRPYKARIVASASAYRRAGYQVAVDVGLQYTPAWALHLPHAQLRSQLGTLSGTADYVFNVRMRHLAAAYIREVMATVGPVWSYRLGLSENGETLYPDASRGQWWAFGPVAQGRFGRPPPRTRRTPLPGWVPGETTWRGQPVTSEQVRQWYDWYLDAVILAHVWEARVFRSAGFTGVLQLVMPGSGTSLRAFELRRSSFLRNSADDSYHTMNTGAVWFEFLRRFPLRRKIAVDISSVYDSSGSPRGNGCEVDDTKRDWRTDPAVRKWSSTRWLSYLSRRLGYHYLMGESTGNNNYPQMQATFTLANQCRFDAVLWAWDYQLYDGHASISQLSTAAIQAARRH
jgi:hypothetical protein